MTAKTQQVLDHGFVKFIEAWGSDERIIESARMSTGKGFLGWGPTDCPECDGTRVVVGKGNCPQCLGVGKVSGDEKLLRFLYENKHSTPFEFGGMTIEVQAPIFVFREWHRHRTQSYNEMSARYTPLPDVNYLPSVERLMLNSRHDGNRQAGTVAGAGELRVPEAEFFRQQLRDQYTLAEGIYQGALAAGVPKELARVGLPVGRYSRMRASTDLRNWLGFLTLRMAPAAQWEIRQYALAVGHLIRDHFPQTWELFGASAGRGP